MATTQKALPRGIRNRNPGNLKYTPANLWAGMSGRDSDGFCVFYTATKGIRALGIDIVNAVQLDGCDTLSRLISHYAPPDDNDTAQYVRYVTYAVGLMADSRVVLSRDLFPLVLAIINRENGEVPYAYDLIAASLVDAYALIDRQHP